jgi:hypothetical protein
MSHAVATCRKFATVAISLQGELSPKPEPEPKPKPKHKPEVSPIN